MPYTMKIQPIDFNAAAEPQQKICEATAKPVLKSRFMRLFERPFSSVLKTSAAGAAETLHNYNKDGMEEFEPSSVCLSKMVQSFMEEDGEKQQQQRCGKKRCNCFNRNCSESSDEEPDSYNHACHILKSLVSCVSVSERNLLADTAKIVERHKINKRKDGFCRKIVAVCLIALGYDAAICKGKWDKSPSFLAGEYEYVDAIIEGERLIIDIDFRAEFDIARPTKSYKLVLQTLPNIFVGKVDRLEKIIGIVSEAGKQSLKKKGMPFPPWRKADYVKSKWLSPFSRIGPGAISLSSTINNSRDPQLRSGREKALITKRSSSNGEFELILEEKLSPVDEIDDGEYVFVFSSSGSSCEDDGVKCGTPSVNKRELPEIWPKNGNRGVEIVTGLASVIDDKP